MRVDQKRQKRRNLNFDNIKKKRQWVDKKITLKDKSRVNKNKKNVFIF